MTNWQLSNHHFTGRRSMQDNMATKLSTELSEEAFFMKAYTAVEVGYKRGHSLDYITANVQRVIIENPLIARGKALPVDQPTIRKQIVKPIHQSLEIGAQGGEATHYDISRTADCMLDDFKTTMSAAGACAGAFTPGPIPLPARVAGAVLGCGTVVVKVAGCIQDGAEGDQ